MSSNLNRKFVVTIISLIVLALGTLVAAPTSAQGPATIRYVVQPGDTLSKLAQKYAVTVQDLVAWNGIRDPNLIYVGQELIIQGGPGGSSPGGTATAPVTTSPAPLATTGGPLSFTWAVSEWRPDDPDYVATFHVVAQSGQPPYTFYHDGLVQKGDTFEVAWRRCLPKPGSVGVADAAGTYVKEDYWLIAPYCPLGVEILEPAEGAHLKHFPRNFNVTWKSTVDPAPGQYGMEIEVWENGGWHSWKQYGGFKGELFFVPDVFPGDLGGRVRMWGIYEGGFAGAKTPWRYFQFRVTY